jgi:O-antigen ligase
MTLFATVVYAIGILVLFALDREPKSRTSIALWLPVVWLLINASRPISVWLQVGPPQTANFDVEGSPLDRDIYLVLIAAAIFVLLSRQTAVVRVLQANLLLLLFLLYCAVSCSWSAYPSIALKRWIKFLGDFMMVLIVLTDSERSPAVKRLLARVGFVLVPLSILLIKYYPLMSRYYSLREGKMFVSGVAEDKNMLGLTCLVFGLGAWWRLLRIWREKKGRDRTRRLIAHFIILAMVLWLFSMANSATSASCFLAAGGLMTLISLFPAARKPLAVHLLVAAIVCVSFSVLFLDVGGGALQAMGRNPTLTGRTEIWKGLLAFTENPTFGTGFESFWLGERLAKIWASGELLSGINESHNGYLELFFNLGWIGIALLAAIIVRGYLGIFRAFRKDPQTHNLQLAFFTAALTYNFAEAAYKATSPMWFVFLLAVVVVPNAPSIIDGYDVSLRSALGLRRPEESPVLAVD